uniref:G2 and S phase-expressed protein 1 N-terminal domain-containing protein n=1 Tax=Neolamprologus brichardi TaxID=32507 RepID=A0A3Q4H224_NEOBR
SVDVFFLSRGDEDEDEVFVGPVGHKEKCVSVNVASPLENHSITWSPLTGEQLEAVCQEAHRLASQLQSTVSHDENRDTTISPNKRQTFCVQDSPLKQLPPVIQRQLQRGSGSSITSSIRPTITPASSIRPTSKSRLSTCSPVIQPKAQPRTALRGKSNTSSSSSSVSSFNSSISLSPAKGMLTAQW